jgi:hypothetical protein
MQHLLEFNPHVWQWGPEIRPAQASPQIVGPVVPNDTDVDEAGGIFPSVIYDGGRYRIWYSAWQWGPESKLDISYSLAYAESDDGYGWRQPALGLVDCNGRRDHNLVGLPLGGTCVCIGPTAPASHRYRALGPADSATNPHRTDGWSTRHFSSGHDTARSADVFDRQLGDDQPRFIPADTAAACWNAWAGCARYAVRKNRRYGPPASRAGGPAACSTAVHQHGFRVPVRHRGRGMQPHSRCGLLPAHDPVALAVERTRAGHVALPA